MSVRRIFGIHGKHPDVAGQQSPHTASLLRCKDLVGVDRNGIDESALRSTEPLVWIITVEINGVGHLHLVVYH